MSASVTAVQLETTTRSQTPRRRSRTSKPAAKPSALRRLAARLNPPSPDPKKRQFAQAERYYLDRSQDYCRNRFVQVCSMTYVLLYLTVLIACPFVTPNLAFCVILGAGFGIAAIAGVIAAICTCKIARPRSEAESFAIYYTGCVDNEGLYIIPKNQLDSHPYAHLADERGRVKLRMRDYYKVFIGQDSHNSLGHV